MNQKPTLAEQNETNVKGNNSHAEPDDMENEDEMNEDTKMAVARQFYMGGAASPRSLGPSVSTEGFMLFRNIFGKIFKRGKNSDMPHVK